MSDSSIKVRELMPPKKRSLIVELVLALLVFGLVISEGLYLTHGGQLFLTADK